MANKDSWELGPLGDGVAEVVTACQQDGPQPIASSGANIAVVISQADWLAIRSLLKDHLAAGSAAAYPGGRAGDTPFTWIPRIVGRQAGEDGK
ncbi:type II toxin-antitoxin system Phd/YefM family antitoxin [Nitrospirillum bahiense]|uniref:Uncharacterized protein n=1 Tax=Nitrospirillum amazonense TaxID=28077 RepID=A0A560G1F5_9PROT|nr:hypothetical protein [Nitrospirillum amazonense]TWB27679.1 hypothetical protein FBZ88_106142 [Nitrospirillum amazonense]